MSEQRHGYFGAFGGQFMPETLMNAVIELEEAYNKYKDDPEFVRELEDLHKTYTGRPSLLYYADLSLIHICYHLLLKKSWHIES